MRRQGCQHGAPPIPPMPLRAPLRRHAAAPAPAPELAELTAEVRALRTELDALRGVAAEGRDMAARAYERLERGPELLARMRDAPDYAAAWDDEAPLVSVVIATYNQ